VIDRSKPDEYRVLEITEGGKTWYEVREMGLETVGFGLAEFNTRSKSKAIKWADRKNKEAQMRANRTETWL
jgi:hypothetical protein